MSDRFKKIPGMKSGMKPGMKAVNPGQPIMVNINPKDLERKVCTMCGSEVFVPAYRLLHVSALQSPVGKEGLGTAQVGWLCAGCGALNSHINKGDYDAVNKGESKEASPFDLKVEPPSEDGLW